MIWLDNRVHFELVPYLMNEYAMDMENAISFADYIIESVRLKLIERGEPERIMFGIFAAVQALRTMWVGVLDNITWTYQPEDNPYEEIPDDSRVKMWKEHIDFKRKLWTGEFWNA